MVSIQTYHIILAGMAGLAVIVFTVLFFVKAGYGLFVSAKWGPSMPNRLAWTLMELPALAVFVLVWWHSGKGFDMPAAVFASLFTLHYAQRSLLFPFMIKGNSRMPVLIVLMGTVFNVLNAVLMAISLFRFVPAWYQQGSAGLLRPQVIAGLLLFVAGMAINIHSDSVIRHLRKPGDTAHHLPEKGLYRYVTSANYFGEILEWTGFAIACDTPAAWLFVAWTFANLAPRAAAIRKRYCEEFGIGAVGRRKRLIPFIW